MAIEFICPTCNGTLRVGDESAGRVIRCGACQTTLRVPGEAVAPPASVVPVAPPHQPAREPEPSAPASATGSARANESHPESAPPTTESSPKTAPRARPVAKPGGQSWDPDWNTSPGDDHGRPDRPERGARPRRKRPPAPPKGRGALFWLVAVGGVFTLLTFGCCGGGYLLIPGPKWQTHESAKGGFKVELPAPPRADMDKIAGEKADPNTPTEGTILFGRFEEYAIVYRDLPAHELRFATDKELIDEAVKGMKDTGEARVTREKDTTVGGFPAREIEFSAKGGGWFVARIIIADTRVYVIVAGGRFAKSGNENARRFLDSFEITDPKLKTAAQKKADEEKAVEEQNRVWKEQEEKNRIVWEKAEAERRRVEEERRVADERAAAERSAKERERREKTEAAFRRTEYDGPPVPGTKAADDVAVYDFEERVTGTAPGVRGKGVFLRPGASAVDVGTKADDATVLRKTIRAWNGYTLSAWVRVREAPVTVFLLSGSQFGPALDVTVGRTKISAQIAGEKRSELSHTWEGDEKWHHIAFVSERNGTEPKTRLYFDGALVASGQVVAVIPGLKDTVRFGRVEWPKGVDRDEVVGAIDECAMFGRPLTDTEVAALAGRKVLPVAPAPRPVE